MFQYLSVCAAADGSGDGTPQWFEWDQPAAFIAP
jgi:hypothetical protein